ncbi:MAG: hypothetical protein II875_08160 [Clostridia bacterium]|nr:hypothetical protein [Clostridia bacterium]
MKPGKALTVLIALLAVLVALCARAEVVLEAAARPDRYYGPFETLVSVRITNTLENEISLTALDVNGSALLLEERALKSGEQLLLTHEMSVTKELLDAGHFFVTLNYEYTDASGRLLPSVTQTMCAVKRMEDVVSVRLLFALPDGPLGEDDSVLMSYILENTGDTDISNAVLICYPEGYMSPPAEIKAGEILTVKRRVALNALSDVRVKLSCESAHSGTVYTFEQAYGGGAPTPSTQSGQEKTQSENQAGETDAQGAQASDVREEPELRAEVTKDGLTLVVRAGSSDLTDVAIAFADGKPVRTLTILKAGLSAAIPVDTKGLESGKYVFRAEATAKDGQRISFESEPATYEGPEEQYEAQDSTDVFDALMKLPPLWPYAVGVCAAALLTALMWTLLRSRKRHGKSK